MVIAAAGRRQRPASGGLGSAPFARRGLVLLHDAGRDAPALADGDAVVSCPGPDVAAALAARRGTHRPPQRPAPGLAGVLDKWCELLTERIGVLLAQVDLVVRTAESEPHGLVRRAAIKVVFQRDGYSLGHLNLHNRDGACYRTQASVPATAATPQIRDRFHETNRLA